MVLFSCLGGHVWFLGGPVYFFAWSCLVVGVVLFTSGGGHVCFCGGPV